MDRIEQTELTRDFFDAAAAGWTARYRRDGAVAARKARFLAALQEHCREPAEILDFGCGSGDIALHLATAGYRVTGFDLSAEMIAQAGRSDSDRRVRWVVRNPEDRDRLPFDNGAFAGIVASSVLEYVPNPNGTLAELARVLRPGGWLLATVPDVRHAIRRREVWMQRTLAIPAVSHLLARTRWREGAAYLRISVNRFAPTEWRSRLRASGFDLDEVAPEADPLLLLAACKT